MGSRRSVEPILVCGQWQRDLIGETAVAAGAFPDRGLRFRNKGKHFAPAPTEWFWCDRRSSDHHREGNSRAQSRWDYSFQRSGRSGGAPVRTRINSRINWQETDLRHLSRTSDSRVRVWWIDLQTEIRTPRRESAGQRFAQRQGCDHFAKSRIRGRSEIVAARSRSDARKFE